MCVSVWVCKIDWTKQGEGGGSNFQSLAVGEGTRQRLSTLVKTRRNWGQFFMAFMLMICAHFVCPTASAVFVYQNNHFWKRIILGAAVGLYTVEIVLTAHFRCDFKWRGFDKSVSFINQLNQLLIWFNGEVNRYIGILYNLFSLWNWNCFNIFAVISNDKLIKSVLLIS